MQTAMSSQLSKITAGVGLVILTFSFMTTDTFARTNNQTVPTAPPPTAPIEASKTATSPGQPPVVATEPVRVTATHTQSLPASATAQSNTTSPSSEPGATEIPGGGTLPQLTWTDKPIEKTLTEVASQPGSTSTQVMEATASTEAAQGDTTGVGTIAMVIGLGLLFVALVVWWVRSRRTGSIS